MTSLSSQCVTCLINTLEYLPPGRMVMCRALTALPLDPNEVDGSGSTALHRALTTGPPCALLALCDLLLQAGARADARNGQGDTAVHLVLGMAGGRLKAHVTVVVEVLRRLIKSGADMNAARLLHPHEKPLGMALILAWRTLGGTANRGGVYPGTRRRREGRAQAQGNMEEWVQLVLAVVEGGGTWDEHWRDPEEGHSQYEIFALISSPLTEAE